MKKITVTVVHKDGTVKEFTYETTETYLGPVLEKDGLIGILKEYVGRSVTLGSKSMGLEKLESAFAKRSRR